MHTKRRSFQLFVIMILLLGCKKDEPDVPTSSVVWSNEITTLIDGQAWSGDIFSWAKSGGTRQIDATGINASIQIFMPEDTIGVFDAVDHVVTVSYNDGTTTWSNNVSGEVRITANTDDHIAGDFEVVLASYFNTDTLTLTSGVFYFK